MLVKRSLACEAEVGSVAQVTNVSHNLTTRGEQLALCGALIGVHGSRQSASPSPISLCGDSKRAHHVSGVPRMCAECVLGVDGTRLPRVRATSGWRTSPHPLPSLCRRTAALVLLHPRDDRGSHGDRARARVSRLGSLDAG